MLCLYWIPILNRLAKGELHKTSWMPDAYEFFVSLFWKSYGAPLSSYMHIKLHKDETGAWFTLKITHSIQTTDMRQNVSFFSSRMSKVKQISVWTATAISLLFVNILTLNSKTLDFIDRLENMNIFLSFIAAFGSPMIQKKLSNPDMLSAPQHIFQKQKSCPQLLVSEYPSIQHLLDSGILDKDQLLPHYNENKSDVSGIE